MPDRLRGPFFFYLDQWLDSGLLEPSTSPSENVDRVKHYDYREGHHYYVIVIFPRYVFTWTHSVRHQKSKLIPLLLAVCPAPSAPSQRQGPSNVSTGAVSLWVPLPTTPLALYLSGFPSNDFTGAVSFWVPLPTSRLALYLSGFPSNVSPGAVSLWVPFQRLHWRCISLGSPSNVSPGAVSLWVIPATCSSKLLHSFKQSAYLFTFFSQNSYYSEYFVISNYTFLHDSFMWLWSLFGEYFFLRGGGVSSLHWGECLVRFAHIM